MPTGDARRHAEHLLKRQAIQIAALLPDDRQDALAILDFTRSLLVDFLGEDAAGEQKVVQLVQRS